MTCARRECDAVLTPRQLARGSRYCSKRCHAQLRRLAPPSTQLQCLACPRRLTPTQVARRNAHCSARCAMRTRWGRPAPSQTTCRDCGHPLTRRQVWRRRDYCSKACVKRAEWRRRPDRKAVAIAHSQATHRRAFLVRLRAFLLTASPAEAGARGWRNGWSTAARRARARGLRVPRRRRGMTAAAIAALVATAPSRAEAYRACYRAAYNAVWPAARPEAA